MCWLSCILPRLKALPSMDFAVSMCGAFWTVAPMLLLTYVVICPGSFCKHGFLGVGAACRILWS